MTHGSWMWKLVSHVCLSGPLLLSPLAVVCLHSWTSYKDDLAVAIHVCSNLLAQHRFVSKWNEISNRRGRSCTSLWGLCFKMERHHFCHTLLAKTCYKASLNPEEGNELHLLKAKASKSHYRGQGCNVGDCNQSPDMYLMILTVVYKSAEQLTKQTSTQHLMCFDCHNKYFWNYYVL